ncbi:MAG TPA: DUF58 domain-containing protein [Abditibacterium sp.]
MASLRSLWYQALTQRLITLPRLTAAHELPRTSLFRSLTLRLMWGFWSRFLTSGGRYFFLATVLFLFYAATAFEIQAFVPLAYAFAVWFFALVATIFARPRVALEAHHGSRVAAGEKLSVELMISGISRRVGGESAVIPHRLPVEIDVVPPTGAPVAPLPQGAAQRVQFELKSERRGVYDLRGYRVETDFPFGLVNAARVFAAPRQLIVHPRFEPLERLELPLGQRTQSGGEIFVASRGESLEYIGNRDYREGDSVRDIDWRATARLSRPIVREFREEVWVRAALILDNHVPRAAFEQLGIERNGPRDLDFENAVSLAAACAQYLHRSDFLTEILATGADFHALQAGRGPASLDEILDVLAGVESSPEAPWNVLWPRLAPQLDEITSVVCLFLDWDEARRDFAALLLDAGVAVKCVVVRSEAPTLDPANSWPVAVPILGAEEFRNRVRQL